MRDPELGADRAPEAARAGDTIDAVRWDYDPEDEHLSPLVATARYFSDFPWEPEDVFADETSDRLD